MSRQGGPGVPARWDEGGRAFHAGTVEDVRFVVAPMPAAAKDGFDYGAAPWDRFHHSYGPGTDVPAALEQVRTGDERSVHMAFHRLWSSLLHSDTGCAAGALAVPFLIRIALMRSDHRAEILAGLAGLARRQHFGDGSRTGLLRAARADDQLVFEASGYLGTWSVQAARQALAADAGLLLPLLGDPDPEVRQNAAHALAAAAGPCETLVRSLHVRLRAEDDPAVRACLVLAIGQLAWEERHAATIEQMRAWWQDPFRPIEVRVCAALSWLCLTDGPVPGDLRALLDISATGDLAALLGPTPWMIRVDDEGNGLRKCLDQMYNPEKHPHFTSSLG
ncbi:HEAT repeat domain-containing protein [Kitasatospora sp. NA04385]|uniref:HEAT repeat domain-containing protein n=1 Tax=Kitasatospora sp. NA04385 TaxID=2742135 RepID=UPI001591A96C|nr:HEAT repeat domain-containing protein [Kitasatospora sp. NA04385]QKW23950.1 HEAT repeat domain-containing protein [Kitasatospora sp. NA04385]